jgi:hypothetical protein
MVVDLRKMPKIVNIFDVEQQHAAERYLSLAVGLTATASEKL